MTKEILNKEGTLAVSQYKGQLVRLANAFFTNVRYIPKLEEFPSGVITKGQQKVYYDLNYPYQKPIFALDENDKEIARWLSIKYEVTKDGKQRETHIVREKNLQTKRAYCRR